MKNITKFTIIGSLIILTGCPPNVDKTINKLSGNVTDPIYTPFNLPQSSINLPSIFVGNEKSIESVCFKGTTNTEEVKAPDSLKIFVNRDTQMKASFQAELEKELVKAGLNVEAAKSTSKKISIEADGLSIVKLSDISKILPDFNSATCNTASLKYYVNNRTVITGALKAKKYVVKTETGLSNQLKTKLNAAIDTLDVKLSLAFEKAVNASGDFEYIASDVFFGALTTKLAVVECKMEVGKATIKNGTLFEIDKKELCSDFKVRFKRSSVSSDFTVEIFPENNPLIGSGQIDVTEGKVTDILVNSVTLAALTIDQIADPDLFKIGLSIYIVGISAEELLK